MAGRGDLRITGDDARAHVRPSVPPSDRLPASRACRFLGGIASRIWRFSSSIRGESAQVRKCRTRRKGGHECLLTRYGCRPRDGGETGYLSLGGKRSIAIDAGFRSRQFVRSKEMSPLEFTSRARMFEPLARKAGAQSSAAMPGSSSSTRSGEHLLQELDAGRLEAERPYHELRSRGRSLTSIVWTKSRQEGLRTELP
jgi:hypothetical protein